MTLRWMVLGFALALTGCAISTSEQAYNAALIKQVGAGSTAEAQLIPTFRSLPKTSQLFSAPDIAQALQYLIQGRLRQAHRG